MTLAEEYPELRDYLSDDDDQEPDFERLAVNDSFDAVITVCNLPVVPQAKFDKLRSVLQKIFLQMGKIKRLEMPMDPDGSKTAGFAFIEFEKAEEARQAVELTNGYALDKSHVFKVQPYAHLLKLGALPSSYQEPEYREFTPRLNPSSWLSDPAHRDQFVVRHANETELHWCEKGSAPLLEYGGEREKEQGLNWCELYVAWSPQGSYLATFHRKGVALWGGAQFEKQGRFAHNNVKHLEFSPGENYMLTCNFDENDPRAIIFWEVRTGRELRSFPMVMSAVTGMPLMFKWGFDDQYVARMSKDKAGGDVITIYETPSMNLLDKKSLRADGIRDFAWSPKDNIIAYWAPEIENSPARVTLVEVPSRHEIRQKNLFNVTECHIHWQSEGDYLCVKVLRHTKSKKTLYNSFELFRVREQLVPVEMLEIKELVQAFAWEPQGHRFAVVHGDGSRPLVSFYDMNGGTTKRELTLMVTLENRQCNNLFWSPMGGYIVLAGIGDSSSGVLEFYDVDNNWSKECEHYRVNEVAWDPSGRNVCTAVIQPIEGNYFKYQMDNGFKFWTFQGEEYHYKTYEKFHQFAWRPRPATLLSSEQRKTVIKNLRKYERRFEREDKQKERQRDYELTSAKRRLRAQYRATLAQRHAQYVASHPQLVRLRGGYDSDDETLFHVDRKVTEHVVSSTEEIVN